MTKLMMESQLLLLADAYRDAVLAGVRMQSATIVLEATREALLTSGNPLDVWDAFDAQVNKAGQYSGLQPILVDLRERWRQMMLNNECGRLEAQLKNNPATGSVAWLCLFVDALTRFRLEFAYELCLAALPFLPDLTPPIEQIRLWTSRAQHGRWVEAHDLFEQLGRNPSLRPLLRARAFAVAADIDTQWLDHYDRAQSLLEEADALLEEADALLEEADALSRDKAAVATVWAYFYHKRARAGDREKARDYREKAATLAPEDGSVQALLGDALQEDKDLSGAEAKFLRAGNCSVFAVEGYLGLLGLIREPSLFGTRKDQIPGLIEQVKAIPTNSFDIVRAFGTAGYACELNAQPDQAHKWYREAISHDPECVLGYAWEGYFFFAREEVEPAAECFQRLVKVAPEAMEGYWGLSWITEKRQDWPETIRWCEESLKRRPEWETYIRVRLGKARWSMGQVDKAVAEYAAILRVNPKDDSVIQDLKNIASGKNIDAVVDLLNRLREKLGTAFAGTHHNLLGNFYDSCEAYEAAATEYVKAISAEPGEAEYRINLARTYRKIHEWESAKQEIERAFELQKDARLRDEEFGLTLNDEGLSLFDAGDYLAAAEKFAQASERLPRDAVIHANLADAWQNARSAGKRHEELGKAIEDLRRAVELTPDKSAYSDRLSLLEARRKWLGRFGETILDIPPLSTPIVVEIGDALVPKVDDKQDQGRFIFGYIPHMRDHIKNQFGFPIPGLRMRGNPNLVPGGYVIMVDEVPVYSGAIDANLFFCTSAVKPGTPPQLPPGTVQVVEDPLTKEKGAWLSHDQVSTLSGDELVVYADAGMLIRHIEVILCRHLADFLGMQEVETLLAVWRKDDSLAKRIETALSEAEARLGFARLLRTLVREQIPITAPSNILAAIEGLSLDSEGIAAAVRAARLRLKASIPANANSFCHIELPLDLENSASAWLTRQDGRVRFDIPPQPLHNLLQSIRNLMPFADAPTVLVVRDPELRQFLQRMVDFSFPFLMVQASEELLNAEELSEQVVGIQPRVVEAAASFG